MEWMDGCEWREEKKEKDGFICRREIDTSV